MTVRNSRNPQHQRSSWLDDAKRTWPLWVLIVFVATYSLYELVFHFGHEPEPTIAILALTTLLVVGYQTILFLRQDRIVEAQLTRRANLIARSQNEPLAPQTWQPGVGGLYNVPCFVANLGSGGVRDCRLYIYVLPALLLPSAPPESNFRAVYGEEDLAGVRWSVVIATVGPVYAYDSGLWAFSVLVRTTPGKYLFRWHIDSEDGQFPPGHDETGEFEVELVRPGTATQPKS